MSSKKGIIEITRRDQKLLTYLFQKKIATVEQVHRDIFEGASGAAARLRLVKLKRGGYIAATPVIRGDRPRYAYHATPLGLDAFRNDYHSPIDRPTLKSDSSEHDLTLVDIDHRLSQLVDVEKYLTENELKSVSSMANWQEETAPFFRLRSDRMLFLTVKGQQLRVALEYERSVQSRARYETKLSDYYQAEDINAVLYVCRSKALMSKIGAIDTAVSKARDPKFFFCTLDTFLNSSDSITFSGQNGATATLK